MRRSARRKGETRDGRDSVATGWLLATGRRCSPSVKQQITTLVVEVADRADAWRDAAIEAELAFVRWKHAAQTARGDAAAAYMAAIDCEEKAASDYRTAWEACCTAVPQIRVSGHVVGAGSETPTLAVEHRHA